MLGTEMEEGAALLLLCPALPSPAVNFSEGSGQPAAAPFAYLLASLTPSTPIEGDPGGKTTFWKWEVHSAYT